MTAGEGSARSVYPDLTGDALAGVAADLVEVVCLRHPEGLDPGQLTEVRAAVASHLAATERLHRFALTNADEPAFIMPAAPGGVL